MGAALMGDVGALAHGKSAGITVKFFSFVFWTIQSKNVYAAHSLATFVFWTRTTSVEQASSPRRIQSYLPDNSLIDSLTFGTLHERFNQLTNLEESRMKKQLILMTAMAVMLLITPCHAQDLLNVVYGGQVIADDGTFLGKIGGKYQSDSIANEYGSHGSAYASDSIWNKYGTYGSKYSTQSPFNKYSSSPPQIFDVRGRFVAYLTVNKLKSPRVNPYTLRGALDR